MLDFYLIGINLVDLCNAKSIVNGRLEYQRAKTKRLYSIKVEPEALAIIERYKGKEYLLNILDDGKNYHDFLQRMNLNLKRIGKVEVLQNGKKIFEPLHPDISTYWARHTWATLAIELGFSMETVSAGLGHLHGEKVTLVYVAFRRKTVDECNRALIDYVLGKKKGKTLQNRR
jgi:integrase